MNRVTHWGPIVLFIGNGVYLVLEEKKNKNSSYWDLISDIVPVHYTPGLFETTTEDYTLRIMKYRILLKQLFSVQCTTPIKKKIPIVNYVEKLAEY